MPSADIPTLRVPFLRRVEIRDYKSIGYSAVDLRPLTVLVGKNGSGKSNFVDALRFLADSLQTSLDHAVRSRGIIYGISRRGIRDPRFIISLEIALPEDRSAMYSVGVGTQMNGHFEVASEHLELRSAAGGLLAHYHMSDGKLEESSIRQPPSAQKDSLYLVKVSGFLEFRPIYAMLAAMRFYDLNAGAMRRPQEPDPGMWLRSDGSNLASVVARLGREQPETLDRISQYLAAIVPGVLSVEGIPLGPFETLRFVQEGGRSSGRQEFFSPSMSDGTLRALASLVAVRDATASLVAVEEPEASLHPAATAVLMDGLREAAEHTQILLTSHSPDLLDQMDLEADSLLAVALQDGVTRIAPIDKASFSVIRDQLYTAGELLRMDQLEPDRENLAQQKSSMPWSEEKGG